MTESNEGVSPRKFEAYLNRLRRLLDIELGEWGDAPPDLGFGLPEEWRLAAVRILIDEATGIRSIAESYDTRQRLVREMRASFGLPQEDPDE